MTGKRLIRRRGRKQQQAQTILLQRSQHEEEQKGSKRHITPDVLSALSEHKSSRPLRQMAVLQMQGQQGNGHVQRTLAQRGQEEMAFPRQRTSPATVQRGFWGDAWDVTKAVGKGVYSVGEDIVGGAARTGRGLNVFNSKEQLKIAAQNERAYGLLKDIISNRDSLTKLVTYVVEHQYSKLSETKKVKIDSAIRRGMLIGGAKLVGRMVIGKQIATMLAKRLATKIATTSAYKMLAKKLGVSAGAGATGVGIPITLLMLQGTLERAGKASDRLASQEPELYRVLKQNNLDMAWFLIEPHMDEIKAEFDKKIEEIEREADSFLSLSPAGPPP